MECDFFYSFKIDYIRIISIVVFETDTEACDEYAHYIISTGSNLSIRFQLKETKWS